MNGLWLPNRWPGLFPNLAPYVLSDFKLKFAKMFVKLVFSRPSKDYSAIEYVSFLARSLFHQGKENGVLVGSGRCIYEFKHTYIVSLIREKSFI